MKVNLNIENYERDISFSLRILFVWQYNNSANTDLRRVPIWKPMDGNRSHNLVSHCVQVMEQTLFMMKIDPFLVIIGIMLVLTGIKISSLILVIVGIVLTCLWFTIMDETDWL